MSENATFRLERFDDEEEDEEEAEQQTAITTLTQSALPTPVTEKQV